MKLTAGTIRKVVSLGVAFALAGPGWAATKLPVDANHSTIGFAVSIMGIGLVRGKFTDFTVTVDYDEKNVARSSVTAVIKTASIHTGIAQRDAHLRTADFFDAEKYPEITFRSTRVEKRGGKLSVTGPLSMHGVTREITIPFAVTGKEVNPATGVTVYGFSGSLTVNRRDFGITWKHTAVANWVLDEVEIELRLLTRAVKDE